MSIDKETRDRIAAMSIEERNQEAANNAGAPDCVKVLFESMLKLHDGDLCFKHLLPKGWELNDYSPTENLIEIEDTNKGDRFWVYPKQFFHYDFKLGQRMLLVAKGATNFKDIAFQSKVLVDRYDAVIERKRCYLLVIFKSIKTDQEAVAV